MKIKQLVNALTRILELNTCSLRIPSRAVVVAIVFSTAALHAKDVTFNFEGEVTYVWDPNCLVAATPIQVGSPIQASLHFDTATPDLPLYANDPTQGSFTGPGWLKVSIGGLNFEQNDGVQVDILHGANGQEMFQAMALYDGTPSTADLPTYFQTMLIFWQTDRPYNFLSDAELPTSLDFSKADHSSAVINADNYQIMFSVVQVPEPSTWALVAMAILTRSFYRRRN